MIIVKELARCLIRGCPVRYVSGEPRLCNDHARDPVASTVTERMAELVGQVPVGRRNETQVTLFTKGDVGGAYRTRGTSGWVTPESSGIYLQRFFPVREGRVT